MKKFLWALLIPIGAMFILGCLVALYALINTLTGPTTTGTEGLIIIIAPILGIYTFLALSLKYLSILLPFWLTVGFYHLLGKKLEKKQEWLEGLAEGLILGIIYPENKFVYTPINLGIYLVFLYYINRKNWQRRELTIRILAMIAMAAVVSKTAGMW